MTSFPNLHAESSIMDILMAAPDRYGPILVAAQHMMRGEGGLGPEMRELLAAYVSGLNGCEFCHGVHGAVVQKFGVDTALLERLLGDVEQADLDAGSKAIFRFAHKLTISPAQISDVDRKAVLDAGNSPATLSDIIAIVSLFSFFNRLADGHGVMGNAEIFARDAAMLDGFGYVPPVQEADA